MSADLEMFAAFVLSDLRSLLHALERNPDAARELSADMAEIADRILAITTPERIAA